MEETLNANARAVLEAVRATNNHPTALEVYDTVRQSRPHIGLATIYRVLHQLSDQGMIRELGRDAERCRYDARTVRHDHAVCTRCGALIDLPVEIAMPDGALKAAARAIGMQPRSYEIKIYGMCAACQEKE